MLQTSLTGQMIPPGIQGTALGIWHRSASESFVPCLVSGHQPASATTTSEREIKRDGTFCLFLRLVCSSFFVTLSQLSRLVVILAKHKGDWSRMLSNTCWDEYLKQESLNWAENNLIWTNDFTTNYPRDCPGYLKAFGFGLFCALPCLWPPACFFWERIQKKIKERRERNLEAFERRRR